MPSEPRVKRFELQLADGSALWINHDLANELAIGLRIYGAPITPAEAIEFANELIAYAEIAADRSHE